MGDTWLDFERNAAAIDKANVKEKAHILIIEMALSCMPVMYYSDLGRKDLCCYCIQTNQMLKWTES